MRVSSLFFSDHSHVRAVHSSPTRRSSDLRGLRMAEEEVSRVVAMAWGVAAAPQRGPKRELSHERIVEAAMEIADAEGLDAVTMQRVARSLDRKSTRLNSSHVAISYAVFCLKK